MYPANFAFVGVGGSKLSRRMVAALLFFANTGPLKRNVFRTETIRPVTLSLRVHTYAYAQTKSNES